MYSIVCTRQRIYHLQMKSQGQYLKTYHMLQQRWTLPLCLIVRNVQDVYLRALSAVVLMKWCGKPKEVLGGFCLKVCVLGVLCSEPDLSSLMIPVMYSFPFAVAESWELPMTDILRGTQGSQRHPHAKNLPVCTKPPACALMNCLPRIFIR